MFLEKTSDKARYSTLKLQELNAKLKALQDENDQVQRALSEDLCNKVLVISFSGHDNCRAKTISAFLKTLQNISGPCTCTTFISRISVLKNNFERY